MDGDESSYDPYAYDSGNSGQYPPVSGMDIKLRDLEEKQRILKDRLLLIGQNMVEFKEKTISDNLEMKKDIEILKTSLERLRSFIETLSGEISNFARREDLDILIKQARMFQPLKNKFKPEE